MTRRGDNRGRFTRRPLLQKKAAVFLLVSLCMMARAASGGVVTPGPAPAPPGQDMPRDMAATLDTGHPVHVVAPGQEGKLALVLTNATGRPADVTAHVRVESFDGSVTSHSAPLRVPAGGPLRWPIPRRLLGRLGIKWIEYRLEHGGKQMPAERRSLAYMRPSGPTPGRGEGFLFGIAYGAGPDNRSETAALAAGLLGVKVARGHASWGSMQKGEDQPPGAWDWAMPDTILAVHERQGIEVQLLLSGTPGWAVARKPGPDQKAAALPPRPDAWRTWVGEMAKRYSGRVRFWEIWNEPDIGFFEGTTAEYLALLRSAHGAIKEVNPRLRVLTGGFANMSHREHKPGMLEAVLRDGQPFFDTIAYHRHGPFPEFRQEIDGNLLPLRDKAGAGGKPLYFTETAMDTRFGERHQAATLVKKAVFAWSRGAMAYTWFNLHDMSRAKHPREPGLTYGLLTKDGHPKAAYPTYNTLIGLLRGKRFVRQFPLPKDQWAFLFADDREQVIVAWNENPATAGAHLVLKTDAAVIRRVDLMGNDHPVSLEEGRTPLQLDETPHYLRLASSRAEPVVEGALVAVTGPSRIRPGQTLRAEVEVWNPLPSKQTVEAKWGVPEGWAAKTAIPAVTVEPRSRARIGIDVSVPEGFRANFGQITVLNLSYRLRDAYWVGTVRIPVAMGAVRIPTGGFPEAPQFTLDRAEQVVNLTEADPNTEHLLWKGRGDLSARVWLARAGDSLKVRVAVTDDAFQQSGAGRLEDGDSIRMALQVPGQDGVWLVTLADVGDAPKAEVSRAPVGFDAAGARVELAVQRQDGGRTYEISLPDGVFGLSEALLAQGVRFNLLVNDNDGRGRKGWLEIAPGLGRDLEPGAFPLVLPAPRR